MVVGGANQESCQTQLLLNFVELFWGSLGVVLWLSCGFDNKTGSLGSNSRLVLVFFGVELLS